MPENGKLKSTLDISQECPESRVDPPVFLDDVMDDFPFAVVLSRQRETVQHCDKSAFLKLLPAESRKS